METFEPFENNWFFLWNVCNRNGDKLNVNCRKAKMLTVLQLSQFRSFSIIGLSSWKLYVYLGL